MTVHIVAHERDRLINEAEQRARELKAALDLLFERHLQHSHQAPAHVIARLAALSRHLEDVAGHESLADLEPEKAPPPACPTCVSPRVVDVNATTFGCAECGGLFFKETGCSV